MKLSILLAGLIVLPVLAAPAGDAKVQYEKLCVKCHGADGKGNTKTGRRLGAKDYTDPAVQAQLKDDSAFKACKEGLKDKDGKELMKPSEGVSDEEIKAMIAYMRTFKP